MFQKRGKHPTARPARAGGHFSRGAMLAVAFLSLACGGKEGKGPPGRITVFAAASLQDAFTDAGRVFEGNHPGTTVRFNFAGSQQLATQIELGADADVFASADERWMTRIEEEGFTASRPVPFVENRLVVIVPRANPGRIDSIADLGNAGVRVVMGTADVPAGNYARHALESLSGTPGYPPDFDDRVLANAASLEENVKLVLAKVRLGEADAGFVYASDVAAPESEDVTVLPIPPPGDLRATYPVAVLRRAGSPGTARAFVQFLCSSGGAAVLSRHGFLPVR